MGTSSYYVHGSPTSLASLVRFLVHGGCRSGPPPTLSSVVFVVVAPMGSVGFLVVFSYTGLPLHLQLHGCDGLLRLLGRRRQGINIGAWFLGHARLYHLQPLPLPSRAHTMCVLGSAWLHFLCCGLHLGAHFVIIVIIPPFFHGR